MQLIIEFCWHFTNRKFSTSASSLCKNSVILSQNERKNYSTRLESKCFPMIRRATNRSIHFTATSYFVRHIRFEMSIICKKLWKKSQNWIPICFYFASFSFYLSLTKYQRIRSFISPMKRVMTKMCSNNYESSKIVFLHLFFHRSSSRLQNKKNYYFIELNQLRQWINRYELTRHNYAML